MLLEDVSEELRLPKKKKKKRKLIDDIASEQERSIKRKKKIDDSIPFVDRTKDLKSMSDDISSIDKLNKKKKKNKLKLLQENNVKSSTNSKNSDLVSPKGIILHHLENLTDNMELSSKRMDIHSIEDVNKSNKVSSNYLSSGFINQNIDTHSDVSLSNKKKKKRNKKKKLNLITQDTSINNLVETNLNILEKSPKKKKKKLANISSVEVEKSIEHDPHINSLSSNFGIETETVVKKKKKKKNKDKINLSCGNDSNILNKNAVFSSFDIEFNDLTNKNQKHPSGLSQNKCKNKFVIGNLNTSGGVDSSPQQIFNKKTKKKKPKG